MKIDEVINNEKEQPDSRYDPVPLEIEDVAKFARENCQPWLSQTDEGHYVVYRGFGRLFTTKPREHIAFVKDVRTNRRPMNTPSNLHERFDSVIAEAGRIANRSNSVFVVGSESVAKAYGGDSGTYVILPVGQFHYTWAVGVRDWFLEMGQINPWQIRGDDGTLKDAINLNNEIMISAHQIVAIEPNAYNEMLADHLFREPLRHLDLPRGV